jgi:hypothetical protein
MIKKTNKIVFFSLTFYLVFICSTILNAQKQTEGIGLRFGLGPVLGFYSINTYHAINPKQKMSLMGSFKKEIKIDRGHKNFILIGVDYFIHGLNFKSYYFKPDSLKLYDKTFAYDYSLIINELGLPFQFKYSFNHENNSVFSPYFMIGYHLKYLLPANLKISQNGNQEKEDIVDLKFRNPFISNKLNSYVSATIGWQKNSVTRLKGSFYTEFNFRYGFSQYYFEENYSANSLYINSTHLYLHLGVKF